VVNSICETVSGWPLADSSIDLILIAFAAHEVRDSEAKRITVSAGAPSAQAKWTNSIGGTRQRLCQLCGIWPWIHAFFAFGGVD
jgi:hypothetical protein